MKPDNMLVLLCAMGIIMGATSLSSLFAVYTGDMGLVTLTSYAPWLIYPLYILMRELDTTFSGDPV